MRREGGRREDSKCAWCLPCPSRLVAASCGGGCRCGGVSCVELSGRRDDSPQLSSARRANSQAAERRRRVGAAHHVSDEPHQGGEEEGEVGEV